MKDDSIKAYYDARAPEYEQIYFRDMPDRRKELDDDADRLGRLADGKSVVELACGTGYWTAVMSEVAVSIVAVDSSLSMLKQAAGKKLPENVRFVQSDMFEFESSRRFDLVALGFWFSHQPRQEYGRLFDLLDRLVAPDGHIWMVDNNPPAEGPHLQSTGTDQHGNNYKERFLDNGQRYEIIKNYFSDNELREILSPRYQICRLDYGKYYWSVVLGVKTVG